MGWYEEEGDGMVLGGRRWDGFVLRGITAIPAMLRSVIEWVCSSLIQTFICKSYFICRPLGHSLGFLSFIS